MSEHVSGHIGSHHDWHSESYVRDWISSDSTRDADRRPLLRWAASLLPLESSPAWVLDVGLLPLFRCCIGDADMYGREVRS